MKLGPRVGQGCFAGAPLGRGGVWDGARVEGSCKVRTGCLGAEALGAAARNMVQVQKRAGRRV